TTAAPAAPVFGQPTATILVVEDNPNIARLIDHHLQKAGYGVRVARSAEEALASLAEALPDLITLDLVLPGMQGDELAQRLQADPITPDIPVLIISAFADAPDSVQFGALVLPKPIDQDQLLATVAQMLHGSQHKEVLIIDHDGDVRTLFKTTLAQA